MASRRRTDYRSTDGRSCPGAPPPVRIAGSAMDNTTELALVIAAGIGLVALLIIVARQRREDRDEHRESPFGVSTEGMKRCPKCGTANLWMDATCVSCGSKLRG